MTKDFEFSEFNDFDYILAISRGGMFIGSILTYQTTIPNIELIKVKSYSGKIQGEVILEEKDLSFLKDKKVLLADDLVDTGQTMIKTTQYVQTFKPKELKTLVIFKKTGGAFQPDYYMQERNSQDWINFFYNRKMSFAEIIRFLEGEGY